MLVANTYSWGRVRNRASAKFSVVGFSCGASYAAAFGLATPPYRSDRKRPARGSAHGLLFVSYVRDLNSNHSRWISVQLAAFTLSLLRSHSACFHHSWLISITLVLSQSQSLDQIHQESLDHKHQELEAAALNCPSHLSAFHAITSNPRGAEPW